LKEGIMLAKRTVKNQITLPKTVAARFGQVEYFDVTTDGDTITLRPLRESRADEVRAQLAQLGVEEQGVPAALSWARKTA
jgi:hypothetical protein